MVQLRKLDSELERETDPEIRQMIILKKDRALKKIASLGERIAKSRTAIGEVAELVIEVH